MRPAYSAAIRVPSGDDGIKDAFPAKEHIFDTRYSLDIDGTSGGHCREISGINDNLLSRCKLVFFDVSVKFEKDGAVSGQTLHDKSFSAEETAGNAFWKKTDISTPAVDARKALFWAIISCPGAISNARISPGKLDANAISPVPPCAV